MKLKWWTSVAAVLFLSSTGLSAQARVSVAAAANLSAVAPALASSFHQAYPGNEAVFTLGSSGSLVTQIANGAPFDVFLSADMDFAKKLVTLGLARGPVQRYARGKLVLLTASSIDLSAGLGVVADRRVGRIANSNPELAPYGRAARQALVKLGLWAQVVPKLVVAQNIAQSVQFTLTGADVGFVNQSALYSPSLKRFIKGRDWIEVDSALYDPIEQGFVVILSAQERPEVQDFARFLLSPAAVTVFESFGYSAR